MTQIWKKIMSTTQLTLKTLIIHDQCGPIFCSCPPSSDSFIFYILFTGVAFTQIRSLFSKTVLSTSSLLPEDLEIPMISERDQRSLPKVLTRPVI